MRKFKVNSFVRFVWNLGNILLVITSREIGSFEWRIGREKKPSCFEYRKQKIIVEMSWGVLSHVAYSSCIYFSDCYVLAHSRYLLWSMFRAIWKYLKIPHRIFQMKTEKLLYAVIKNRWEFRKILRSQNNDVINLHDRRFYFKKKKLKKISHTGFVIFFQRIIFQFLFSRLL